MNDEHYVEYCFMQDWQTDEGTRLMIASLLFLQTLERFGLTEVRPTYLSRPRGTIAIWVDDEFYDERFNVWLRRFKNGN